MNSHFKINKRNQNEYDFKGKATGLKMIFKVYYGEYKCPHYI